MTAVQTIGNLWLWGGFALFVLAALVVDFVSLSKQGSHRVSMGEAARWSALWIALALVFNGVLWWYVDGHGGREAANDHALEFLTGYLIEKSLAIDNIFVFLTVFSAFAVPEALQKRVLMIGILAAIVLRGILIGIGAWLIAEFSWILYVFGAFLIYTGIKMAMHGDGAPDMTSNRLVGWARRVLRITPDYDGERFFTRDGGTGRRMATPLLLVALIIGVVDVVFAVDSIPAIFAITTDPFIVLTSNVFAILGLRAMYFLLAGMAQRFHLLSYGLAAILAFVGTKMLIAGFFHIPPLLSLAVVGVILAVTMIASVMTAKE